MKVSIVTNAYNQAKYLEATVESVLNQDWPDIEYFVVDPGSKDDTARLIERLQTRHPGRFILCTEPDRGPADGLNKAFAKATGDLFFYLNGDDLLLPGAIAAAVKSALAHPGAAAIYADGYLCDAEGRIIRRAVSTGFSPWRFVHSGAFILQQSTFYRADAFRAVGGFNPENGTSWDIEILLEMALRGMKLKRVRGYWSMFRMHPGSITVSQRLAEESRRHHLRYFVRVTGRTRKTQLDRITHHLVRWGSRVLEPRASVIRLIDASRRLARA